MSDQATKVLPNLRALAGELATQDNACTEGPMFVVQQRRRRHTTDEDSADGVEWRNHDEDWREATTEEGGKLEADYDSSGKRPSGWARLYYSLDRQKKQGTRNQPSWSGRTGPVSVEEVERQMKGEL